MFRLFIFLELSHLQRVCCSRQVNLICVVWLGQSQMNGKIDRNAKRRVCG